MTPDDETERFERSDSPFDFDPKDVCSGCRLIRAKNGTCNCHQ